MLRLILIAALAMHGIGHILFVANAFGYWKAGTARARLFSDVIGIGQMAEGVIGLLWLLPLLGFLAGTALLATHQDGWRTLLLVSVALSTAMLLVWWSALNPSSAFFALVFNIAVIAVLLWRPEILAAPGA